MIILLTGGSGRLGSELETLIKGIIAPSSTELDIKNPVSINNNINLYQPDIIVHAAAYTDVSNAENDRENCWRTNVEGTRNLARACSKFQIPLIYISTDYVFYGDTGNYKEDDSLGPVCNYYSLSKLVAEEIVKTLEDYLIIRTSFRPREWAYPKAFHDLYTSQDYVDIIAPDIALAIMNYEKINYKIVHIARERKSAYELAKRRRKDVLKASKKELAVVLPDDISLNIDRWERIKGELKSSLNL